MRNARRCDPAGAFVSGGSLGLARGLALGTLVERAVQIVFAAVDHEVGLGELALLAPAVARRAAHVREKVAQRHVSHSHGSPLSKRNETERREKTRRGAFCERFVRSTGGLRAVIRAAESRVALSA